MPTVYYERAEHTGRVSGFPSRRLIKQFDSFLLGIDFKARSGLNALVPPFA
jgi:hypothetical protein